MKISVHVIGLRISKIALIKSIEKIHHRQYGKKTIVELATESTLCMVVNNPC